jgi:hypothetical protein
MDGCSLGGWWGEQVDEVVIDEDPALDRMHSVGHHHHHSFFGGSNTAGSVT